MLHKANMMATMRTIQKYRYMPTPIDPISLMLVLK